MSTIRNSHWTLSKTNHNMKNAVESTQVTVSVPVTDRAKCMCAQTGNVLEGTCPPELPVEERMQFET